MDSVIGSNIIKMKTAVGKEDADMHDINIVLIFQHRGRYRSSVDIDSVGTGLPFPAIHHIQPSLTHFHGEMVAGYQLVCQFNGVVPFSADGNGLPFLQEVFLIAVAVIVSPEKTQSRLRYDPFENPFLNLFGTGQITGSLYLHDPVAERKIDLPAGHIPDDEVIVEIRTDYVVSSALYRKTVKLLFI